MRIVCLLMLLALTSCASAPEVPRGFLTPAQLNARTDQYDGEKVRVQGWMRAEFEYSVIWEDQRAENNHSLLRDCVTLLIPDSMNVDALNRHYVRVEGVFLKKLPAGFVQMGGCNVTRLQLIEGSPPVVVEGHKNKRAHRSP